MGYYKVTFQDDSPYLQHYGVMGMKWGRRKDGMPQGTIGSGSARGRARVNRVLTDRQRRIAKGVAIGAGAAALGLGAHMTGADRAIIDALRNHKSSSYISRQKGIMRTAGKLGRFGLNGVGSSTKQIGSRLKSNAAELSLAGRKKRSRWL